MLKYIIFLIIWICGLVDLISLEGLGLMWYLSGDSVILVGGCVRILMLMGLG